VETSRRPGGGGSDSLCTSDRGDSYFRQYGGLSPVDGRRGSQGGDRTIYLPDDKLCGVLLRSHGLAASCWEAAPRGSLPGAVYGRIETERGGHLRGGGRPYDVEATLRGKVGLLTAIATCHSTHATQHRI